MKLLIFNSGSSSLSFKVFSGDAFANAKIIMHGKAHRIGVTGTEVSSIGLTDQTNQNISYPIQLDTHAQAAQQIISEVHKTGITPDAIGHRIVHDGNQFSASCMITPDTMHKLQECLPLAPIHNPNSLAIIQVCQNAFTQIPQYVTFDTTFHRQMPERSARELLPNSFLLKHHIRHYGFHGLSYTYVLKHISQQLNLNLAKLNIIACHLGTGGSSITAIQNGKSIDTSMGFTPLQGLIMSTRSGDLDPFLPLYLMQVHHHQAKDLTEQLNKQSGLLGVSGFSSDVRDIQKAACENKQSQAQFALELYVQRLKKYIGAYATILDGLDMLIFTDDIGIQNPALRSQICTQMDWLGLYLDEQKNAAAPFDTLSEIQSINSKVCILAMPTDEESIIAHDGFALLQEHNHVAI